MDPIAPDDILLTITVRKDATARVEGQGRTWETSGHQIILRTPAGGELEIAWPEDFQGMGPNASTIPVEALQE